GGGGGAEPGKHPDAQPCRREQVTRQELPYYQKEIKNDREMYRVKQTDRGGKRHEARRMERQRGVELQDEREHVAGGQHACHEGVAQHSEITHGLVLSPSALVPGPSFVLGRPSSLVVLSLWSLAVASSRSSLRTRDQARLSTKGRTKNQGPRTRD